VKKCVALLFVAVFVVVSGCGGGDAGEDLPEVAGDAVSDSLSDEGLPDAGGDLREEDTISGDTVGPDAGDDADAPVDAVDALDAAGDATEPDVPFCTNCTESEPLPLPTYAQRQLEYLDACAANNGPGAGNTYGQVCRVARGLEVNTAAIDSGIEDLTLREDCSDFRAAALVRMLYLDQVTGSLDETNRQKIVDTLHNYKYWLTQPGKDKMCYWSENHQILFHSSEYLVGQMFPETAFLNAGMTGAQHMEHARPLILKWLDLRGATGFAEWHSNVYFNEDIPALVNLADFAQDPEISTKAMMVLDIIAYDMAANYFSGYFATTHGRTYEGELINGLNDHTTEGGWMLTGLGAWEGNNNFSAVFLATSGKYFVPDIIESIAAATSAGEFEHRQRDSIDILDGPSWNLTYTEDDDIPTWAGFSAIAAPEIINGTLAFVDKYDLWDGFLFGDLPDYLVQMVKQNMGTQDIVTLSEDATVVSRGIALQSINTYVYRTTDYQIAAAQDYHPGWWGSQTLMWQATLDREAFVVASLPTSVELDGSAVSVAGDWVGSWFPRATVYRNAGVFQYRADVIPDLLSGFFKPERCHAYFRRVAFDEVRELGQWVIGRKGDGYLALYSRHPTEWAADNDYELVIAPADGKTMDNTWLVQMGSASEFGTFEDFVTAVTESTVAFAEDGSVQWDSPSVGMIAVGWTGPFTVDGVEVDLGPYERFDNAHSNVAFGKRVTRMTFGDRTLELDFAKGTRKVLEKYRD